MRSRERKSLPESGSLRKYKSEMDVSVQKIHVCAQQSTNLKEDILAICNNIAKPRGH